MEIDMTRHSGDKSLPVVECTDTRLQKYRVRTDIQPYTDEESGEERGVTFIETEFPYKPTLDEVKEFVYGVKNAQIDEQILTGYQWNGKVVWLSTENQFNYFGAFVIACLASVFGWLGKAFFDEGFSMFPVVFKLGTNEEPHYETFNTMDELKPFCIGAFQHVWTTLRTGWTEKAAIDFTPYELALNPVVREEEEEETQEA